MIIHALELDCSNPNCNCDCCDLGMHFNLVYVNKGEVDNFTCDNCKADLDLYSPVYINDQKGIKNIKGE